MPIVVFDLVDQAGRPSSTQAAPLLLYAEVSAVEAVPATDALRHDRDLVPNRMTLSTWAHPYPLQMMPIYCS